MLCRKSSYKMNGNSARYIRRERSNEEGLHNYDETNLPQSNGTPTTNHLPNPSPYESPLTLSTRPLLTSSIASSLEQNGLNGQLQAAIAPYAIPADSLEQYRSSQLAESLGQQEYEVPLSRTNTLSNADNTFNANDTSHPPINVYSTLDDAAIEKSQFTNSLSPSTTPLNYTSLYPPNMEQPHSYVQCPSSPIREASELYSEPPIPPRRNNKGSPPAGGISQSPKKAGTITRPHILTSTAAQFDNPVYGFEPPDNRNAAMTTNRSNHTYSSLDRGPIGNRSASFSKAHSSSNETYSEIQQVNSNGADEPTYFELEKPVATRTKSDSRALNPEPTYFELEKPAAGVTRTKSDSQTPPDPTYFELEKPKDSASINNTDEQSRANDFVPKPEPTYFVVEPSNANHHDNIDKHKIISENVPTS